ncbi:MAG: hypothetical protein HQK87_08305 [Nitrospinae bacterium]|nr:hypothetical protein [Nitrospinota bacterium]
MSTQIAVLSKNKIRGQILVKALGYNGLEALYYRSLMDESDDVLKSLWVVVFDSQDYSPIDVRWISKAFRCFKGYTICIGDYSKAVSFNITDLKEELCLKGAIDPELVVYKVKQVMRVITNRKNVQKQEINDEEHSMPKQIKQQDDSTPKEDLSLLNDLKGFLGLK